MFSIIVATCGRRSELVALLDSLAAQQHQAFEVVVVDQNPPVKLSDVRERYQTVFKRLIWENVDFKAANRARNLGLARSTGDVVTFADDDCEYRATTLSTVAALLAAYPTCSVVTGKSVDKFSGRDSMSIWPERAQALGLRNVLNLSLEFTTFYRRAQLAEEQLDPIFGPGTRFASREGPDLMLRLLYAGHAMRYEPAISIFHPEKATGISDPSFIRRTQNYEIGFGALLAKHVALRKSFAAIVMLFYRVFVEGVLGFGKNLLTLRMAKMRFWRMLLKHRLVGYREYRSVASR